MRNVMSSTEIDRFFGNTTSAIVALKDAQECVRPDGPGAADAEMCLEAAQRMIALALAEIRKGP